eukprot:scaffold2946_cov209-Alexandrium_tamarense.AAC.6
MTASGQEYAEQKQQRRTIARIVGRALEEERPQPVLAWGGWIVGRLEEEEAHVRKAHEPQDFKFPRMLTKLVTTCSLILRSTNRSTPSKLDAQHATTDPPIQASSKSIVHCIDQ